MKPSAGSESLLTRGASILLLAAGLICATPPQASATVTFGIEVGGQSTIPPVAPGSTITADVVVEVPAGELLGTYGLSIDLGAVFGGPSTFISGTSSPPPGFFPGGGAPSDQGGGIASQWNALGLFGPIAGPIDISIGTITFVANGAGILADPGFFRSGIDGIDTLVTPNVEFRPLDPRAGERAARRAGSRHVCEAPAAGVGIGERVPLS